MICFVDMDGVVAEFVPAVLEKFKSAVPKTDIKWDLHIPTGITPEELWTALDYEFWCGIPVAPQAATLVTGLIDIFGLENVVFLSSPPHEHMASAAKHRWIQRHFPKLHRQFLIGPAKSACAHWNALLIDDHQVNVDKFVAAGGSSILVPRPWNRDSHLTTNGYDYDPQHILEQARNEKLYSEG